MINSWWFAWLLFMFPMIWDGWLTNVFGMAFDCQAQITINHVMEGLWGRSEGASVDVPVRRHDLHQSTSVNIIES